MKKALFPGSFDPPTEGHLWVIKEGAKIFDKLYIAIGKNPKKKYVFSKEERLLKLGEMTKNLENVEVIDMGEKYQYEVANNLGVEYLLYGERNEDDFKDILEYQVFHEEKGCEFVQVKLTPPKKLREISSTSARNNIDKK